MKMQIVNRFKVISEKGNRAELVYLDGDRSITRHCDKAGSGWRYALPEIKDASGNIIVDAFVQEFRAGE